MVEKASGNSSDKYTTEEISITLSNQAEEYYLSTYLSSNNLNGSIYEFIVSTLYTTTNNGLIPSVKVDKDGNAVISNLMDQATLNKKTFNKVYANFSSPTLSENSFLSIYYTATQGIVGFYDGDDILWNLKAYK